MKYLAIILILLAGCNSGTTNTPPCKTDTVYVPKTVTKTVHDTVPKNCPKCPPCKADTVHDSIPYPVIKVVHDTVPKPYPVYIHDSIPVPYEVKVHDTTTVHDSIPYPVYQPCDSTKWNITTKDTLVYIKLFIDNSLKKYLADSSSKVKIVYTTTCK